jgi:hypothetical protein
MMGKITADDAVKSIENSGCSSGLVPVQVALACCGQTRRCICHRTSVLQSLWGCSLTITTHFAPSDLGMRT